MTATRPKDEKLNRIIAELPDADLQSVAIGFLERHAAWETEEMAMRIEDGCLTIGWGSIWSEGAAFFYRIADRKTGEGFEPWQWRMAYIGHEAEGSMQSLARELQTSFDFAAFVKRFNTQAVPR